MLCVWRCFIRRLNQFRGLWSKKSCYVTKALIVCLTVNSCRRGQLTARAALRHISCSLQINNQYALPLLPPHCERTILH